MADSNDEQDLDLDGEENTDDESEGNESTGDEASKDSKGGEDKRVRDLQSKADKAEARANKAEAALAKATARGDGEAQGKPADADPEREALIAELRETSLDAVYAEFEELALYKIDRSLIDGSNRAEMRASATALVGLVKSVATKSANRALKEHGITPEPAGATRQPPKRFDDMTPEEFEREIAKGKSGGAPIW